ncbi:MAG: hypothetical protein DRJ61_03240 [Acidobacteria bacterium]|nr:MAG: hypothetical protein DRJ61_03240 [Acidobacteriota bacterium]
MKQALLVVCVVALVAAPVAAADMSRGVPSNPAGSRTMTCGNVSYDNGEATSSAWFGGGQAGDPDLMMGVLFNLADFGFTPGTVEIVSYCAGNDMDWGGPWPNAAFIYSDSGGVPNDAAPLFQGIIDTGNGAGDYEVTLPAPVMLGGDFWVMIRGDAAYAGEDFNLDFDAGPGAHHSYVSDTGIGGLTEPDYGGGAGENNYMLRATLQEATGPTPTPPPGGGGGEPIPAMNRFGMLAMIALLAGVAILVVIRRK